MIQFDEIKNYHTSLETKGFENLYINSRKKEGRIYSDDQVARLPLIESSHIHFQEWQVRERSVEKLTSYLQKMNRPLSILEAGCGNGWLSAKLSAVDQTVVIGSDINSTELEQARRVFTNKPNLRYIKGDIRNINYEENRFDVIIFAASIQYYPSLDEVIQKALLLLNKHGMIHILDSYFYTNTEIESARQRSFSYYQSIGYKEMAEYYFHHSIDSLKKFEYTILFDPSTFKNKIFGNKDPFPWICIKAT